MRTKLAALVLSVAGLAFAMPRTTVTTVSMTTAEGETIAAFEDMAKRHEDLQAQIDRLTAALATKQSELTGVKARLYPALTRALSGRGALVIADIDLTLDPDTGDIIAYQITE